MVSLEAADRPNFFLHARADGSVGLAKRQRSEAFHQHASFSLHRGTWQAGLVALESLAKPGSFLHPSGLTLALRTYEHTEAFRGGALFQLLGKGLLGHRSRVWGFCLAQLRFLPSLLSPSRRIEISALWQRGGSLEFTPGTGGGLISILAGQRVVAGWAETQATSVV